MAWVYLDDQFPDHPKVILAGGDAGWLFVCGLAYVKRYSTSGLIPKGQVPKLSDRRSPVRLARRLVEVGLWEDRGSHFAIHDYGDWNKPQESRSAAGRKAARARWAKEADAKRNANAHADASESHSDPPSETDAKGDASGCPPPRPPPYDLHLPPTNVGTRPEPAGEDPSLIEEAVGLAATRYARNQVQRGKATSEPGIARWWLQENAEGARVRAANLLASHVLTLTQLADALASGGNPSWLNAYRKETP
jgi:hypothetical protein